MKKVDLSGLQENAYWNNYSSSNKYIGVYSIFENCENLEELILPKGENIKLEMGDGNNLTNCAKLESLDLSSFYSHSSWFSSQWLAGCTSLANIIWPSNLGQKLTTSKTTRTASRINWSDCPFTNETVQDFIDKCVNISIPRTLILNNTTYENITNEQHTALNAKNWYITPKGEATHITAGRFETNIYPNIGQIELNKWVTLADNWTQVKFTIAEGTTALKMEIKGSTSETKTIAGIDRSYLFRYFRPSDGLLLSTAFSFNIEGQTISDTLVYEINTSLPSSISGVVHAYVEIPFITYN